MKTPIPLFFITCILFSAAANATSIDLSGTHFTITSVYDGHQSQSVDVIYGAGLEVTNAFEWMDSGDSIDLFFDSRNEIGVTFAPSHNFDSADTIELTFAITTPSTTYGAIALIKAIDVQVPDGSVSGPTLDFTMTALDQIGGDFQDPGYVQFTYLGAQDTSQFDPSLAAPEPGTLLLLATGGLGLVRRLRRA